MRSGLFEVSLVAEDGLPLKEELIDGKMYILSEPGLTYHVNISVYRDRITGKFPANYLRFGLFVDGVDVQYWKRLDLTNDHELPLDPSIPVCSKFYGFKVNVSELLSFRFSKPADISLDGYTNNTTMMAEVDATLNKSLGTVKVVVYEAKVTGGIYDNQTNTPNKLLTMAACQQQEGRGVSTVKLFDQATMLTTSGKTIDQEKEKFIPLEKWSNMSTTPLCVMLLYYHTPQMIQMMKHIKQQSNQSSTEQQQPLQRIQQGKDNNSKKRKRSQDDEDEEQEEDVVVIHRVIEAPLLDLSDDTAPPTWTTKPVK